MPDPQTLTVHTPIRLDQFLVQAWPALGRQEIRECIQAQEIQVNGQWARKAGQHLVSGDEVTVLASLSYDDAEAEPLISPYAEPLNVMYEDEALIIVDKAAETPLYPSATVNNNTLTQQLALHHPEIIHIGGVEHAGMVTQLEEGVSGLMIAAKTETAYRALRRHLKRRRIQLSYSVLVEGKLTGEETIIQPIGNMKHTRKRLAVAREGRPAHTYYRSQQHYKDHTQEYTLLLVRPETSRRHQIRVHLSWYGFPVVGDRDYGSRHQMLVQDRLFMHLSLIEFSHPISGAPIHVESPLPAELYAVLRYMTRPKR